MTDCRSVHEGAVRAQLTRILEFDNFDASERNRRFLGYVVEECLAGRGDRIKAYSIATQVFGRSANFDPQLDSIVRIEAGRLRRSLAHYYLTTGVHDPVRIDIPLGSYVPVFASAAPTVTAVSVAGPPVAKGETPPPSPVSGHAPCILVIPFEEEGVNAECPNFTRGLTRKIILGLTRFDGLFVFGPQTTQSLGDGSSAAWRTRTDIDYELSGVVMLSQNNVAIDALLKDVRTGRCVWGESYQCMFEPSQVIQTCDDIAASLVRALAQPYGVIHATRVAEISGAPPHNMTSFDSVTRFQQYCHGHDARQFEEMRQSLELAVQRDPDYAEASACLSRLLVDAVRLGYGGVHCGNPEMLQRGLSLAHRAVQLTPQSSHSRMALGTALWFAGDVEGSLATLELGHSLNPNDSETLAELGFRLVLHNELARGVAFLQEAYRRNPGLPGNYRIGLCLWHLMNGEYVQTRAEALKWAAPGVIYGNLMMAVASARLGLTSDTEAALQAILAIDADYPARIAQDLAWRHVHPEIAKVLVDGLEYARRSTLADHRLMPFQAPSRKRSR